MLTLRNAVLSAAALVVVSGTIASFVAPYAIAQVTIAQAQAALVRDADNPARQPFAYRSSSNWIGTAVNASFFPTVPAGKRLVIEEVSYRADVMGNPAQNVSVEVLTSSQGVHPAYFFQGAFRGPAGSFAEYIGAATVRLYSDPGGLVEILVTRASTAGGSADNVDLSLSGYLVNLP